MDPQGHDGQIKEGFVRLPTTSLVGALNPSSPTTSIPVFLLDRDVLGPPEEWGSRLIYLGTSLCHTKMPGSKMISFPITLWDPNYWVTGAWAPRCWSLAHQRGSRHHGRCQDESGAGQQH